MPARFFSSLILGLLLAGLSLRGYDSPAEAAPRPFRFSTDTFSFANETVWNYVGGTVQAEPVDRQHKREYTRHCFVVTRAAVQFWKFARFDPEASRLGEKELAARIRQVAERSVWLPALSRDQRIVIPGYKNLRDISAHAPGIFQSNIGEGWPVYFRAGNMPMVLPVDRSTEARLHGEISADLKKNYPTIVWLYNFPSLTINHVVVIFSQARDGGKIHYQVYDPNYANAPRRLDYDVTTQTFSYPPTFYYKGGPVTVRAVYRGVVQ